MPEHTIGTREEWQAARDELAKLEAEQAERGAEITRARRDLPWVRVEKDYVDGKKTFAELFGGRSPLHTAPARRSGREALERRKPLNRAAFVHALERT